MPRRSGHVVCWALNYKLLYCIWPTGFLHGCPVGMELFARGSERLDCWQRQLYAFTEDVIICDILVLLAH